MRYAKFERLILLVLTVSVAGMAVAMIVQKTDGVEVFGHLLMLVVIVSSLYWGKRGALMGFLASLAVYIAARLIWRGSFSYGAASQLIVAKLLVYGVLSLLCYHLRTQFRYFFVKLEQQDFIDDETQIGNARFLLQELSSRINEYERYQKPFSLVAFSFDRDFLSAMKKRDINVLRDVTVTILKHDTRAVDELAREGNRLFAILPNVGPEGAQACSRRLWDKLRGYLSQHGGEDVGRLVELIIYAYPEDKEEVEKMVSRLREGEGP